jgi:hypothetical protein
MKFITALIFCLTISSTSFSQYYARAGMEISYISMPSLTDYLNQNFAPSDQQLGTFNSAIVFSGEGGYLLNDHYAVGLEVAYLINSHNYSYDLGVYKLNYSIIMPTIVNYFVLKGEGYDFKFGGGLGIRFVSANQQLPGTPSAVTYSSTGFGLLLKADGNTLLSGNLYANIGVDIRYDFNGQPKSGNGYFVNNANNSNINFNALSAGLRLGVTYIF